MPLTLGSFSALRSAWTIVSLPTRRAAQEAHGAVARHDRADDVDHGDLVVLARLGFGRRPSALPSSSSCRPSREKSACRPSSCHSCCDRPPRRRRVPSSARRATGPRRPRGRSAWLRWPSSAVNRPASISFLTSSGVSLRSAAIDGDDVLVVVVDHGFVLLAELGAHRRAGHGSEAPLKSPIWIKSAWMPSLSNRSLKNITWPARP